MKRSLSTPSLKRCWPCHCCKFLNNTVTWHCLNCESVSVIAPIYKDTLIKKNPSFSSISLMPSSSSIAVTTAKNFDYFIRSPDQRYCKANEKNRKSMTNKRTVATEFAKNLIINSSTHDESCSNVCNCRECFAHCSDELKNRGVQQQQNQNQRTHQHRHPCLSSPEFCYVKQPKYNIITRYRFVDGLHNLKTKLNKSTSNISNACSSPIDNEIMSVDGLFGERVASSNLPMIHAGNVNALVAQSAGQYTKRSKNITNNENSGHFTITTLSRNTETSKMDKNHILNRNGGVFVSVHDWSTAEEHKNDVQMNDDIACNEIPIYAVVNKANKARYKQQQISEIESTSSICNEQNKNLNTKRPYYEYNNSIYATIRRSTNPEKAITNNGNNNNAQKSGANDENKLATSMNDGNKKSSNLQNYSKAGVATSEPSSDVKTYVVNRKEKKLFLKLFFYCAYSLFFYFFFILLSFDSHV